MTDRELIEAAAKAAGIIIAKSPYNGGGRNNTGFDVAGNAVLDWHNGKTWNPLADDGDALRLAVKLGIGLGIDMQDEIVTAYAPNPSPRHFSEDAHEADPYAATRRAITRAAAALAGTAPGAAGETL